MAYATVAGLPVAVGLYTAFVPMLIYALLGSSRVLNVSSTTTLAILAGTQLGLAVPDGDPTRLLTASATLAALTGDSDTCDLDDLLIVLFTAAEFLARDKKQDAGAKLAKAQARLNELRANLPARDETFILGGANPWARRNYGTTNLDRRPTVAVSPA